MRVAGVREFGGPDALELLEMDDPEPGPGQVRVRVRAATVNPTDTFHRNGSYRPILKRKTPPYVPGMDAAGVVDEVGEGVTAVAPGDEVMAVVMPTGARGGAYAELIVVPERSVARMPRGATFAEASTLPMNGLTARLALDKLALVGGETLAVTGAAGAFGGYVVQLAKHEGLRVIADASAADEALVRELGADVVVRRGDDVAARIREAAPDGVDGIADGSVQGAALLPAIKDGGGLAAVRPCAGETQRGIAIHDVLVADYSREHEKLDGLRQLVEDGVVTLRVARTFPAADAAEAHRVLEAGGTRGRLVLLFEPDDESGA